MKTLTGTIVLVSFALWETALGLKNHSCVPHYHDNPGEFDVCKRNLCIVFIQEEPFIFLDKRLRQETPRLFPCSERYDRYPDLDGIGMDILNFISAGRDAYCVYGGVNCKFDTLVKFVGNEVAVRKKHRFVASGLLRLQYRESNTTTGSAPMFQENLVITARRDVVPISLSFERVFQPFTMRAWLVVLGFVLLLVLTALIGACFFAKKRSVPVLFHWMICGPQLNAGAKYGEGEWGLIRYVSVVLFTALLLLYEVSVAVNIFQRAGPKLEQVLDFRNNNISEYAVTEAAASENIFKHYVGRTLTLTNTSYPWYRAQSLDDMIDRMLGKGRTRFIVTFETNTKFKLRQRDLCDEVDTVSEIDRFNGGWYYGGGVPAFLQKRIDAEIVSLHFKDRLRKATEKYESFPLNCGRDVGRIVSSDIFVILLVLVAPLLLITLLWICYRGIKRVWDTNYGHED